MKNSKKDINKRIREQIILAAKSYSTLTGKMYLYVFGEEYLEVIFSVGSFKHLTGVNSIISAEEFYNKAVKNRLSDKQIVFDQHQTIKKAKKKLPCLIRLPELTKGTVCVVKDFSTNTLLYKLGLTNLEFTLGISQPEFNNKFPKGIYIPRSLRIKDKAIENSSSSDFVDFIFEKSTKCANCKYDNLVYQGIEEGVPKSISKLIDSSFYSKKITQ